MKVNKNPGVVNNNCDNAETRNVGKTADQRKVGQHIAKRNFQFGIKFVAKLLSSYKISSTAINNKIKVQSDHANAAGAKVVEAANKMVGRYHWGPPAMNVDGGKNGMEELVKHGKPINEQSRLNCWEGVLQAGMKSGVLPEDELVKWMKKNEAMSSDFDYTGKITELFGMENSLPLHDTVPEPGDIILFYGNAHVALSMGGDQMLHLPNHNEFKEQSMTEFVDSVKSDDWLYASFLKSAAETACYVSDEEVSHKVYDKVCDFSEAVKDLKSGKMSKGRCGFKKRVAQEAFSDIESQLAVRVIKNPWGKMLDLIEN
ncbi:C40 family peptidase [Endozoicomonas sp. SCSIO W0465]|uniref:C40 family peptidase n=1 Tax=Endozoicomonas sp. SCSIO W0465 TaxID=2918516 RepID=UPI002075A712|nr:C40 family peptidase [Endozoicomonas sp. SCSIO W0465]USE37361.1 C40 family peptidase [Endozoicomonas sp. SCSIO W0465]